MSRDPLIMSQEVTTIRRTEHDPTKIFEKIISKLNLENEISNFISTDIEWIPFNNVEIAKERYVDLINFFDTLEDDDDVQNIFSNAELKK